MFISSLYVELIFCHSIVADSACSATAYLGGVKGNRATIGLSAAGRYWDHHFVTMPWHSFRPHVRYKECETQLNPNNHVSTIMDWAQAAGKATGVVSTNGITDASPAGAYAKVFYILRLIFWVKPFN